MRSVVLLLVTDLLPALLSGQYIEARLSAEPPLSSADITQSEAKVRSNPADIDTRLRLLRHYMTFAPSQAGVRSPFQAARLGHVLYLIENFPSDPISASTLTYVPSEFGLFADAGDHATVGNAWTRAVNQFPENANVLVNAASFVYHENPEEAEQLLSRAVVREPTNRKIAANLGFLYAMDILAMMSPAGHSVGRTESERRPLREHARTELDRSRNVFVLAGAGTALPNLFPRTGQARTPNGDREVFEMASGLMSRARELGPQEIELRGPMPLIREFEQFQQMETANMRHETVRPMLESTVGVRPGEAISPPAAIRIGGNAQAAKLVEKPQAVYPPEAMAARIQGIVHLNVVIGQDGRVENATLQSGHPLLVPAAVEAVGRYRYQPTLMNGTPIKVISQVDVPFTFSN
jgi:TonB family protein